MRQRSWHPPKIETEIANITINKKMEMILCIPRMPTTMSKSYVFQSLCRLKWGHISILNEIPLRNDPTQKRVLFRVRWGATENAVEYKAKIQNGDDIKMVHDIASPFFWKIVMGRETTLSCKGGDTASPVPKRTINERWLHHPMPPIACEN